MRLLSHFQPWRQSENGATALEFALIAPALFLFLLGSIEVALIMAAKNVMESATFVGARTGKTNQVATGKTRQETIVGKINGIGGRLLDDKLITVTSLSYEGFDQIGKPEPFVDANKNGVRDNGENYTDVNGNGKYDLDRGKAGFGAAGEIVVYTMSYPWTLRTPGLIQALGSGGKLTLTARAVVKNEPF